MNFGIKKKHKTHTFFNWPNLASGRSKGGLLVSAKIAIKKAKAIGNNGKMFHTACWHSTIYVKLKEPENIINIKIIEENTSS
jgi:hypothetical protein